MAALIGIKLANGEFYPILDEKTAQRKRLVLTTVTDNQTAVQIDLYRSLVKSIKGARYIGSLVIENITPSSKGIPSIEMTLEYTPPDGVAASARDMEAGKDWQHLSVSLKSLTESKEVEITDGVFADADAIALNDRNGGFSKNAYFGGEPLEEKRGFVGIIIGAIAALLLAGAAVWFFVLGGRQMLLGSAGMEMEIPVPPKPAEVPAQAATPPPPPPPVIEQPPEPPPAEPLVEEAAAPPEPPKIITAPPPAEVEPPQVKQPASARQRPTPPVSSYPVPHPIPPEGVIYKIRWGDTLWAISEAFYRNPWDYHFIAAFNKIKNPALIIAGNELKIPNRY
ncbi:MAG: LysM peptidoglycan-binding domain-containing protein [Spirochaetaceae bacterium]|jgi:hypothetical protein|nr:LysM peptidoglycan-binding domain-containing protein [Spirochaetaceae bacterium]